jgi:Fe2+ or Zn2+ uptake regulation protein
MIDAHGRDAVHSQATPTDWANRLRDIGLKVTQARIAVLVALHAMNQATPEEIHSFAVEIGDPLNMRSVYRGLDTHTEHGLVSHIHLNETSPSFQLAERADRGYLVCEQCGRIEQLRARDRYDDQCPHA